MKHIGNITIFGEVHKLHQAYYDNDRYAIVIDEGEFGKLTVNLPDVPLAVDCVHVKMWSENEVLREPALATGLFEDTGERVQCGMAQAEVWKYKGAQSPTWWWLSFTGDGCFLGAVIVEAASFDQALTRSRTLGINPGGEVLSCAIPNDELFMIPDAMRNRLLSRAEAAFIMDGGPNAGSH